MLKPVLQGLVALSLLAPSWAAQAQWGTYAKPYAARSPWNSRPVSPVLGTATIPASTYYPAVAEGAWSTGVFASTTKDLPVTVYGPVGAAGVWDADHEAYRASITFPRWPAGVTPARESDGHADIVDASTGIVHSFWQLRNDNGTWRATTYAWAPLAGAGWGDPAHYYQGARAVGVPASAGLIRKHEVNDGDSQYRHALAMSLTFNGLSPAPAYTFPATSADGTAATANSGSIPEGSLLMLPASFNTALITTAALRKVAATLKTYGAYVVDRNVGTPFYIYVENGSGFTLHPGGWNATAAAELEVIRKALRPLVSAPAWIDGNGVQFVPSQRQNMLSMRGTWLRLSGTRTATFDSWRQAVVCSAGMKADTFVNYTNRAVTRLSWSQPVAGKRYTLTAQTAGGAKLRLDIIDPATLKVVYSSGYLANGASVTFPWPVAPYATAVYAACGTINATTASGTLLPAQ